MEANFMTSVYFFLNILNIVFLLKNLGTFNIDVNKKIFNLIKTYSVIILVLKGFFILFFGNFTKNIRLSLRNIRLQI